MAERIEQAELIESVRNSGDFESDPAVTDQDILHWLHQAYEMFYYMACEKDLEYFFKEEKLPITRDETDRYFAKIPNDYFRLVRAYILQGGNLYPCQKAKDQEPFETFGRYTAIPTLSGSEQLTIQYYTFAPRIPKQKPDEQLEIDNMFFPPYLRFFLIDYAIKRSKVKLEEDSRLLDDEYIAGLSGVMKRLEKRDGSSPLLPPYVPETSSYYYTISGSKIYVKSTDRGRNLRSSQYTR